MATGADERPRLDPGAYARVFEGHHEGRLILEDLVRRFWDVRVWVPGGVEAERETMRRAARREVLHYILARIGQVPEQSEDESQQGEDRP